MTDAPDNDADAGIAPPSTGGALSDADVGLAPAISASTAAPPPPKSGALSDADVGLAPKADGTGGPTPDPTWASTLAAPAIGFNSALKGVLSAPGDVLGYGLSKLTGDQSYRGAGSRAAGSEMGIFNPDAPANQPRSPLEGALQAGGAGAGSMLVPEAALGAVGASGLKMAPQVGEFLGKTFGSADSVPAMAKTAAVGAAGGTTGEVAAQQIDSKEHPYWAMGARLAGNLVGGVAGAAATSVNPWSAVKSFTAPMREAGQEQLAGETLRGAATNPDQVISDLANPPASGLPNEPQLTSQVANDTGISGLERAVQTQPGNQAVFNDVRAQQNQGRVAALQQIQPTGSPEDVSAGLRARLNDIEQQAQTDQSNALTQAQAAAEAVGPDTNPGFIGNRIAQQVNPKINAATENAVSATNDIGGAGTPDAYGAQMREGINTAKSAVKSDAQTLYKAVDPDNSLNAVVAPLREAAQTAQDSLSPLSAAPKGEESSLMETMTSLPDVVPFSDLQALDARVSAAMREENKQNGNSPTWGRLTQMKQATQDAIDNAVANQVAYERSQVASGAMSSESTIEARLAAERDQFYAQRQSAVNSGAGAGAGPQAGPAANAGRNGAVGASGGGPNAAEGAEGVSPEALTPNINQAAADRLNAAKSAWAKYAQTYKNGPIAKTLKTNGYGGQYLMNDSSVPETAFGKGPGGYDNAVAYRNAVQDDPASLAAAHDYAAMTLRRIAENPDGTLDPGKFSAWRQSYADALRAYPGLAEKFSTAAKASEELKKFMPFRADMAPRDLPEVFFHSGPSGRDGVDNLRRLIGDTKANEILSEYAASKLRSTPGALRPDGTLDPAVVAKFQRAHDAALKSFPRLNAKFSTAANATKAIGDVAAANKAKIDGYQAGVIGKVMNAAPEDVSKHVGAIFATKDAAGAMGRLADESKAAGPDAVAGLRKAVADHILTKYISNTEAGTSGVNLVKSDQFQTFVRTNRAALSKVFSPEELDTMDQIAASLHRANRSLTAAKVPGSPGTAAELTAVKALEHKPEGSLLNAMIVGGVAGGELHGGLHGAALGAGAGVAKHIVGTIRAAGYTRVNELVRDALLDPDLARRLMMKAPLSAAKGLEPSLAQKLMRLGTFSAAQQINRARGGRIAVNANPTEAQKAVGNYKKHHMRVHGLNVTIENPRGSYRTGTSADGKSWRVKMPHHYGYVRGSIGADGDHVDAYVGPYEKSDKVFVVDQKNIETGKFDEHKAMVGFKNREAAIGGYCAGFSDGKGCKRMMKITPMSVDEFKSWLSSGKTKEPLSRAA